MEEDDEGRHGKQQCDNVSFPVESVVKKQRENTEEIGTTSSLHHTCQACDHPTGRHPNCLSVYVVKKLQGNNKKQYLWCRAETRKWYHPASMPYMLNMSLSHWRTSKLPCSSHSEKSCKVENENSIHVAELKQNSIHGAELKQNSIHGAELKQNSIHGAELKENSICGAEQKQRRQGARQQRMNFLLPI